MPTAHSTCTAFTARLLAGLDRAPVNAVCSPLSVQVALTMAGLGAAGTTREQLEQVLGADAEELARTAQELRELLAAVGEQERSRGNASGPEPARASLVGGAWAHQGLAVRPEYRELLADRFGSALGELDLTDDTAREAGRREINDWVAARTDGLIEDLVPAGALTARERLVLVSALHLRAAWPTPLTRAPGAFTTAGGEVRELEMLRGTGAGWYEDEHCRATALPTAGGELALAVIAPTVGVPEVLEAWADAAERPADDGTGGPAEAGSGLAALLASLAVSHERVELTLPGVDVAWEEELNGPLQQLGLTEPFTPGADFSGVAEGADWFLSLVLHKAVMTIDEHGMEAAAATALLTRLSAPAPPRRRLVVDAPFLLVAYETRALAPLVAGWIGDPALTR
ncbi:serpin family protein [Brachybacterium sp. AOP43-C2-M15]|uniref:serpin family protein n=1 Tax=Brachybacterium sp. AOP43-C2-M15 TaxID=3457661 RepID=UPI0040343D38